MTRNHETRHGFLRCVSAMALVVLVASGLSATVAPVAAADEVNDAPGTYQLPLRAAEAATRMAEVPPATVTPTAGDGTAAPADPVAAAAPSALAPGSSSGTTDADQSEAPATGAASSAASTSTASGSPSTSHESVVASSSGDMAAPSDTGSDKASSKPPAAAAAKAKPVAAVRPAAFTISGMKFLEGRTLGAGEFSFKLAPAGAARVSARSDLPRKLRPPSTLTDAEKYELVAHGDLVYYPSALQPMPASDTTQNNADGQVSFGPLTFDLSCLGETSTQRHQGTVFCYTVAEVPPRNADGTLADGVTKDERGRCVYQGVTYDDSVKRIYIYAYETGDDSGNPEIDIIPLGDATFDTHPAKVGAGLGTGFVNIFNGAVLDSYDGAVYLADEPIAAGEFNFEVKEVAEDGTVLDDLSVPCEAVENGSEGADVRLIADEIYGEPGRFFYTVRQTAAARADGGDIVLDESSYVITVEVSKGADDDLEAAITHVRKKPAGSEQWVDVDLDAQPSPVVWENRLRAATDPDEGDEGNTGTEGGGTGTDEPSGDEGGEGSSGAAGGVNDDASGAAASEAAGATKPSGGAAGDKPAMGSGNAGADRAATTAKAASDFAQTGDDLGLPMLIAFAVVIASGVAVALLSRRRQK